MENKAGLLLSAPDIVTMLSAVTDANHLPGPTCHMHAPHAQPQALTHCYIRSTMCHALLHLPLSNLPLTPGKPHEEYQKAPWVSLSGLSFHSKSLYHPPFTIWLGAMLIFHHSTPWATACQTTIKQQYEYPSWCTHTWAWAFPGPFHCFLAPSHH